MFSSAAQFCTLWSCFHAHVRRLTLFPLRSCCPSSSQLHQSLLTLREPSALQTVQIICSVGKQTHAEKKYSHSRTLCLLLLSSSIRCDCMETFYLIVFLQVHSKMLYGENILISNRYFLNLFYSSLSSL